MLGRWICLDRLRLLICFYSFYSVKITGQPNIVMQYIKYETDIVLHHGIALEGWTHPTFANPSELSTSIPPLQTLLEAIKTGTCKFIMLLHEECRKREEEYNFKIKDGDAQLPQWKKRKDGGKKRKRTADSTKTKSRSGGRKGRKGKAKAELDDDDTDSTSTSSSDEDDEESQNDISHPIKCRCPAKSAATVPSDSD
jgi:hypothetical protein